MPSPLNVALLGSLIDRPGYGYELAQRLRELLNPEWNLINSGVYSALGSLEEQQLIRRRRDDDDEDRRRVFYDITDLGKRRFEQCMREDSAPAPRRDQLVAKLAVARPQDVPHLLRQLDDYERECMRVLRQAGKNDVPAPPEGSWEEAYADVMTERHEQRLKAELAWIDHARDRFTPFSHGDDAQGRR